VKTALISKEKIDVKVEALQSTLLTGLIEDFRLLLVEISCGERVIKI